MASDKQNPESQVQFVADENLRKGTPQQSVSLMGVKQRRDPWSASRTSSLSQLW